MDPRTQENAAWLALLQSGALKRQVSKQIIHQWCVEGERPLGAVFGLSDAELAQVLGLDPAQRGHLKAAEAQVPAQQTLVEQLAREGIGVLTRVDAAYPESLVQHMPEERLPYLLFYRGELDLLTQPAVGVLGSEAPAAPAQEIAIDLVQRLVKQGHTLVGGYTKGIDRLALDAARKERGLTVGVLPMGLRSFGRSFSSIEEGLKEKRGLLLSPFAPDAQPSDAAALARVPLVASLCDLIVLIEPDAEPAGWPALELVRAAELPVCVWRGLTPGPIAAWLAAGATPFEDCASGMVLVDHSIGAEGEDAASEKDAPASPAAMPEEPEPLPFDDAESAIKSLERSGRVPEVLARRLRETRWD